MIHQLRWKLFKLLSAIAWRVCPEPNRTDLIDVWHWGLDNYVEGGTYVDQGMQRQLPSPNHYH